MSRGPGRIERALDTLFDRERDNAFTLEELCERIYPGVNRIEKKHRISVVRAARNLGKRRREIQCWHGENLGGALVFFRHDEVMSYAMARLKADKFNDYRSNDRRCHPSNTKDESALRKMLIDDRHRELISPGSGSWWRHVQIFLAERDGDIAKLAALKHEQADAFKRIMGRFAAVGRL